MSPATPSLVDVEDVRPRVDELLTRHVAQLRTVLAAASTDADALADAVAQMLTGGKRLRAAFCYWSWRAHGGRARDARGRRGAAGRCRARAVPGGRAVPRRRHGRLRHPPRLPRRAPGVRAACTREHGLTGDAERFGMSAAILLGDLTLDRERAGVRGSARAAARRRVRERARAVFDLMRTEVTVGQYLDVLAQALPWGDDPVGDEARAREVIRAKAARYSVEHPIVLGAALADAGEDELEACRTLGLPLGEAFQLRDDLLGVFGDPRTTGKPAGRRPARGQAHGADGPRGRPRPARVPTRPPCELLRDRSVTARSREADVVALADAIRAHGRRRGRRGAHRRPGRAAPSPSWTNAPVARARTRAADRTRARGGRPARLSGARDAVRARRRPGGGSRSCGPRAARRSACPAASRPA